MVFFRILLFVCLITGTLSFTWPRQHERAKLHPPGYWRTQPMAARLEELRKRNSPYCFMRYRGVKAPSEAPSEAPLEAPSETPSSYWPCGCSATGYGCLHDRTDYTKTLTENRDSKASSVVTLKAYLETTA